MKFLVVSFRHGLLPLALRLRAEGHAVEVLTWKPKYERAWGDRVDQRLRGSTGQINQQRLDELMEEVREKDVTILTDVPPSTGVYNLFSRQPKRLMKLETQGDPIDLRAGWWFDGEQLREPHLLVYDLGAWPGGMGAGVPGGLTLVVPDPTLDLSALADLAKPIADELKSQSFTGLVNAGLGRDPYTGALRLMGFEAGWPTLHLDAWLSSTEDVGGVIAGTAKPRPGAKYTVVVPVSIPPWPSRGEPSSVVKIEGLPPVLQGWNFFYDMRPNEETQELWTAGLDGLVCVARGEGQVFEKAKLQALGLAQQIDLPGKQYRVDVGARVPWVLAQLESQFGLVL